MLGLNASHVENGLVLAPVGASLHRAHLLDLLALPVLHVRLVGLCLARPATPALHADDLVVARRVVIAAMKVLADLEHGLELIAVAVDEAEFEETRFGVQKYVSI